MYTCLLDIETTGFEADYNIILCAVLKTYQPDGKGKITVLRSDSYTNWDHNRSVDAPICKDLHNALMPYDIIIAHNGVNFDVRFMMTRFLKWGIVWPQPKIVDPVRIARRYLRLGRNGLESACHHFGIYGKTSCIGDKWMEAKFDRGRTNKSAMNYVVDHCVADIDILEKFTTKIKHLAPKINQMGSDI